MPPQVGGAGSGKGPVVQTQNSNLRKPENFQSKVIKDGALTDEEYVDLGVHIKDKNLPDEKPGKSAAATERKGSMNLEADIRRRTIDQNVSNDFQAPAKNAKQPPK